MPLISSLKLDGFLSFAPGAEAIPLTPLNVLIGPNGAGKSNLIEAIELLHATPTAFANAIRDGGGAQEWLWKGKGHRAGATIEALLHENGRHRHRCEGRCRRHRGRDPSPRQGHTRGAMPHGPTVGTVRRRARAPSARCAASLTAANTLTTGVRRRVASCPPRRGRVARRTRGFPPESELWPPQGLPPGRRPGRSRLAPLDEGDQLGALQRRRGRIVGERLEDLLACGGEL